ncbi:MAG: hypothetical protein M1819_000722 [Sarea resinae]|nr:MAG: hypothetical protein M1819_000722 [Sarea resinae]
MPFRLPRLFRRASDGLTSPSLLEEGQSSTYLPTEKAAKSAHSSTTQEIFEPPAGPPPPPSYVFQQFDLNHDQNEPRTQNQRRASQQQAQRQSLYPLAQDGDRDLDAWCVASRPPPKTKAALLQPQPPPPPPVLGYDTSPASNASSSEYEIAERWCAQHPLAPPARLSPEDLARVGSGDVGFVAPRGFRGTVTRGTGGRKGVWRIETGRGCADSCVTSALPLYSVLHHSNNNASVSSSSSTSSTTPAAQPHIPNPPTQPPTRTIYFEIRILSLPSPPTPSSTSTSTSTSPDPLSTIAIGYLTPPYPPGRQPGWHRGSLAIHSDDGRRYVCDPWGGKAFARPFAAGDTVGLGMRFFAPTTTTTTTTSSPHDDDIDIDIDDGDGGGVGEKPPAYTPTSTPTPSAIPTPRKTQTQIQTEVFFTHNGVSAPAHSWALSEALDAELDHPETGRGLAGDRDVYAAVGVWGEGVRVEVVVGG